MLPLQVSQGPAREVGSYLCRDLHTTSRAYAAGGDVTLDLEHATGLERCGDLCFQSANFQR